MWEVAAGSIRYKTIRLQEDILKPEEPYTEKEKASLWPFSHPKLPYEFAKVRDSKTALRFELRYAPLGYDYLVSNPEERKKGDPLDWVLEHAKFVRFALELIYAMADELEEKLIRLLKDGITKNQENHDNIAGHSIYGFSYPSGAYQKTSTARLPLSHADALGLGRVTVTEMVNANIANIRQELVPRYQDLVWVRIFHALIEVIWSMVGDIAVKAQQEGGGYLRRCEWCQTPFLATHKRQRFCPPPEGSQQSLCGEKYRWHKMQRNPKRKEAKNERSHS